LPGLLLQVRAERPPLSPRHDRGSRPLQGSSHLYPLGANQWLGQRGSRGTGPPAFAFRFRRRRPPASRSLHHPLGLSEVDPRAPTPGAPPRAQWHTPADAGGLPAASIRFREDGQKPSGPNAPPGGVPATFRYLRRAPGEPRSAAVSAWKSALIIGVDALPPGGKLTNTSSQV
jgi:hypothetical protein